jgi:hypothetical protein
VGNPARKVVLALRGDDDAHALRVQLVERGQQAIAARLVEPRQGFVEEQQARPAHEGAREHESM